MMRRARSPQPSSQSREDTHGYFLLVRQMLERHGSPLALYHHRHSIFTQTGAATEHESLPEQLAGRQEPTQFGRQLARAGDHLAGSAFATSARTRGTAPWHEASIGWSWNCVWQEPARLSQANVILQAYLPRAECPVCRRSRRAGTGLSSFATDREA